MKWEKIRGSAQATEEVKTQAWEMLARKWQVGLKRPVKLGWLFGNVALLELENSLGMRFVFVPGTTVLFSIWQTRVQDYAAYAAAAGGVDQAWRNPAHKGQPVTPGPAHPVVCVSWADAQRFCAWLTEKDRREGRLQPNQSYRLPRDLEWSAAVGLRAETGDTPLDRSRKIKGAYPWGLPWPPPPGAGNYADVTLKMRFRNSVHDIIEGYRDGFAMTAPVGRFPPNPLGLFDLGGNVREWCADWLDSEKEFRVVRGASWFCNAPDSLLSSNRSHALPEARPNDVGFRVVLEGGSFGWSAEDRSASING